MTQFFASCTKRKNESFWSKTIESLAELKLWPKFFDQNVSIFSLRTPREKMSHFDLKKIESLAELKFDLKKIESLAELKFLGQNDSIFLLREKREKMSHFDLKSWVTDGKKSWPKFLGQNDCFSFRAPREKIESFWP